MGEPWAQAGQPAIEGHEGTEYGSGNSKRCARPKLHICASCRRDICSGLRRIVRTDILYDGKSVSSFGARACSFKTGAARIILGSSVFYAFENSLGLSQQAASQSYGNNRQRYYCSTGINFLRNLQNQGNTIQLQKPSISCR